MPLILPTPAEYEHHLSAYARSLAVRRLFAAAHQISTAEADAARIYARLDQDSPEVIAARQWILRTEYAAPYPGWKRHHKGRNPA